MHLKTLNDSGAVVIAMKHFIKQINKDRGLECSEASNEASLSHHEYADEIPNTGMMTPIMRRSTSSTGSDSSRQVILFTDR